MKQPLRLEDLANPRVQMNLPNMCVQCPYRRTLQQLLALWDQNLMKDGGIHQYEQLLAQQNTQQKNQQKQKPPEPPEEE